MKKVENKVEEAKQIITDKELKSIKEQQDKVNTSLRNIGFIETQKHTLLHEYAKLIGEVEDSKKELEEKYGSISIDLETGVYKPIEEKE
tara:strand:- start:1655 stop:1921 length:267 start_codon:yes stop_codon:yes gene_type:complete